MWQLAPKLFTHMKAFSSNTFYLYWNLVAMWCWNIRGRERRQFLLIFFFYFCDVLAIWEPGTDYKGTESANSSWQIFLTCHFWCRFLHCQRSNHFYCLNAWSKLVWINICIPQFFRTFLNSHGYRLDKVHSNCSRADWLHFSFCGLKSGIFNQPVGIYGQKCILYLNLTTKLYTVNPLLYPPLK